MYNDHRNNSYKMSSIYTQVILPSLLILPMIYKIRHHFSLSLTPGIKVVSNTLDSSCLS